MMEQKGRISVQGGKNPLPESKSPLPERLEGRAQIGRESAQEGKSPLPERFEGCAQGGKNPLQGGKNPLQIGKNPLQEGKDSVQGSIESVRCMSVSSGREVQFELLRVLAMLGVVMNHVFNYGLDIYGDFRVDVSDARGCAVWSMLELMKLLALPSVNCYVLITGYFLMGRPELRARGIWRVWSVTWTYAVGIYLGCAACGAVPFSWGELLRNAMPLATNRYWFVTSYVVLLLLAPLVSAWLRGVSRRRYELVLLLGGVVCFQPLLGQYIMGDQQVLLFVYLFIAGGYIRRYADGGLPMGQNTQPVTGKAGAFLGQNTQPVAGKSGAFLGQNTQPVAGKAAAFLGQNTQPMAGKAAAFLGMLALMMGYAWYKNWRTGGELYTVFAMAYHGPVLPLSLALFLIMKDVRVRSACLRRMIMRLAPLSFAVYVIHTQPVVHEWLWRVSGEWLLSLPAPWLPLACACVTVAVFVCCLPAELLRRKVAQWLSRRFFFPHF